MSMKVTLALSAALALGAASAALAKPYPAGADTQSVARMSPRAINVHAEMMRPARPFTLEEKDVFDRASKLF